jgi:hypothetical protein
MIRYRIIANDGTNDEAFASIQGGKFWFRGRLLTIQQLLEEVNGRIIFCPPVRSLCCDLDKESIRFSEQHQNQRTDTPQKHIVMRN